MCVLCLQDVRGIRSCHFGVGEQMDQMYSTRFSEGGVGKSDKPPVPITSVTTHNPQASPWRSYCLLPVVNSPQLDLVQLSFYLNGVFCNLYDSKS